MNTEYYIVETGERRGPFSLDDLRARGITGETLVWRQGLDAWKHASELEELIGVILPDDSAFGAYARPEQESIAYYAMLGTTRIGPMDAQALIAAGVNAQTPVWRAGMADWAPASSQPELMAVINAQSAVPPIPGYGGSTPYGNGGYNYSNSGYGNQPYGKPSYGYPTPHTNWMPWAIGATVAAFLFSCIGVIFGIIAIVQANKANDAYAINNDIAGDQSNSSAKTMTIIALVFAGVGLVTSVIGIATGFLSNF